MKGILSHLNERAWGGPSTSDRSAAALHASLSAAELGGDLPEDVQSLDIHLSLSDLTVYVRREPDGALELLHRIGYRELLKKLLKKRK